MADLEMPNFGRLLGPTLLAVPDAARPTFLAGLEQMAADRYRGWAKRSPRFQDELIACSEREDEIARRANALFPVDAGAAAKRDAQLPAARTLYGTVFDGLSMLDQLRIQASAERQGALAWRGMAAQATEVDIAESLETMAKLEEETADVLDALLENPANHAHLDL